MYKITKGYTITAQNIFRIPLYFANKQHGMVREGEGGGEGGGGGGRYLSRVGGPFVSRIEQQAHLKERKKRNTYSTMKLLTSIVCVNISHRKLSHM